MHSPVHDRAILAYDPSFLRGAESLEAAYETLGRRYGRGLRTVLARNGARCRRFPNWPCNQVKVPEISVAAVWAGPAIDDVGNAWEEDAGIKDLVARLAVRRTPLEQALKAISDVIMSTESDRQKKAKLLDCSRHSIMNAAK
jgi:hypothetical protein